MTHTILRIVREVRRTAAPLILAGALCFGAWFASRPSEAESARAADGGRAAATRTGAVPFSAGIAKAIDRETFGRLAPVHQRMLANLAGAIPVAGERPVLCFSDTPEPGQLEAFDLMLGRGRNFRPALGWSSTATDGGGIQRGEPLTLTYSFIPDGTSISGGSGEPVSNSSHFAFFNGIYGSPAVWLPVFAEMFDRWAELTGITYVYEPNDDGASFPGSSGQLGVRGDIRIGAHSIDGQAGSNILAYNYYPNTGDMVIDSDNTGFYGNTSFNSRPLRNVLAHEAGHGLGFNHVCPVNQTKLMEPSIATNYDGPQLDDILAAQRLYGDNLEENDTIGTATDLGVLTPAPALAGRAPQGATPANDLCLNATALTTVPGMANGNNTGAGTDGDSGCVGPDTLDIWYSYTPQTDGMIEIDTFGSSFDTVLSVHTGCPGDEANSIACNDDSSPVTQSRLQFFGVGGVDYKIRVAGFSGASGSITLNIDGPPVAETGLASAGLVSLDGASDDDYYTFTLPSPGLMTFILDPIGLTYTEGPQTGGMCAGPDAPLDTLGILNLGLQVIDTNGLTVLDTANANGAGLGESLTGLDIPGGTYFARVYSNDATDNVQLYQLVISAAPGTPVLAAKNWEILE